MHSTLWWKHVLLFYKVCKDNQCFGGNFIVKCLWKHASYEHLNTVKNIYILFYMRKKSVQLGDFVAKEED